MAHRCERFPLSSFMISLGVTWTLLASLFHPLRAFALGASPRFVHLGSADGLSHDIVRCILQDRRGFMWFGTQGGLNRYDGHSFTVFHHQRANPESINSDTVNVLYEDSLNQLWIGTVRGLDKLALDRHSFVHYGEIYESVQAILEDSQGYLWIGSAGSGLYRYDRSDGTFRQYLNDPTDANSISDNHVNVLIEDQQGQLWVGTEYGGLNLYDRQQDRFITFHHDSSDPFSLPADRVTALMVDPLGVLWVGSGSLQEESKGGVVTYNPQQRRFFPVSLELSNLQVTALQPDRRKKIWIGSQNGLFVYDLTDHQVGHYQHNPLDPSSLSENKINALYLDDTGVLWIATDGGGMNKYAPAKDRFQRYQADPTDPASLTNAPVGAVLKDAADTVWIGYHNGGLDRFDRSSGEIRHYAHDDNDPDSLSHNHVTALFEDHDHNLWIGTAHGLDRFDPASETFVHYTYSDTDPRSIAPGAVKVILEDRNGRLWIGTEEPGTLNLFEPESGLFTRFTHDSDLPTSMIDTYGIRAILEDHQGGLWLGTYNGLVHFDPQTSLFTQYRHDATNPSSLSDDFVWSLYQGEDETLWVGTHNGLNAFDPPSKEFQVYTVEDGLPDDSIVAILGDEDGNLWLATMGGGISRFNPAYKTFRNFDVSDSLQGNAFIIGSAFQSRDGELFFGGIDGFNAFYPQDVRENPHIPALVFTSFRKFDQILQFEKDLNEIKEIHLSYRDTFFAFEFAALDYTDPAKNRYAYRLEGFDADWIDCGNRNYASYTNIPPGEYVFRVKGTNNDGVWNEQGISLRIVITPPFWQTTWFRLFVIAILSGSIYTVARIRTQQVNALRLSEERFRSLFESAPLGVCEVDLSQSLPQVLQVNHQWETMFHREVGGANENSLLEYFPTTEHSKVQLELGNIAEGRRVTFETKGVRSDGSEFPLRVSAAAVHQGSPRCILVIEDITLEKERRSEEEAIAEERRRIAREIHDGLAQDLAALRLQTHRWQTLVDTAPEKVKNELEWLHDLLGEKIREVRSVIFALRPVALDELGFWAALERFVRDFAEQNQLTIHLDIEGERKHIPPALEPLLFRVLQEGLHNVARHAQANTVWIRMDFSQGIVLSVRDDGVGFDSSVLARGVREGHLGLQQMRERIEALGGTLEIESQPGEGTLITVRLGGAA